MRSDMSKVVIERPRWGHSLPSVKTGRKIHRYDENDEYEDLPKREKYSMNRQANGINSKGFSDFLNPLERYFRSNVGRPWDKVHSEMCEHLDFRSTMMQHVFQHVERMVELHCYIGDDGKIYEQPRWGSPRLVSGLYVHPRTRLLCWKESNYIAERRKIREAKTKEAPTRIPISGKQHYLKSKGIWYIAELERHEPKQKSANEKVVKEILQEAYYDWWVIRKRQLSGKELKAAKLSNDVV
jgi:hypothetical protein